jgi:hypothetical protein
MAKFILGCLLRAQFKKHVETWHNPEGCVWCHIDPPYQTKLLAEL